MGIKEKEREIAWESFPSKIIYHEMNLPPKHIEIVDEKEPRFFNNLHFSRNLYCLRVIFSFHFTCLQVNLIACIPFQTNAIN
jgi:hypothetical protein